MRTEQEIRDLITRLGELSRHYLGRPQSTSNDRAVIDVVRLRGILEWAMGIDSGMAGNATKLIEMLEQHMANRKELSVLTVECRHLRRRNDYRNN